jgi:hypothetical protein
MVQVYNLDVMIAFGYRINSVVGTNFRRWATGVLREHIAEGYTINRARIRKNYESFMRVVRDVQVLLPEAGRTDTKNVLVLVQEFAGTWMSLQAYDTEHFTKQKTSKKTVKLTSGAMLSAIDTLKKET